MPNLRLDDIVHVIVSASQVIAPRDGFNVGLIVGKSAHITAADRCIIVNGLDGLTDAGFVTTDPEYKAATLYFAQNPPPAKLVVGVCAVKTAAENDNPAVYETWVEAITACRDANSEWYGVMVADDNLATGDHTAIAAYVETLIACYFFSDDSAAAITSATTDPFSVLSAAGYQRTVGLYSGTDYAAAAMMGLAMGSNDGTPGSAYTLAYKTLKGVDRDDLNATQVGYLKGKRANYYVKRGGAYTMLEPGVCASGDWFDEILGLDQLKYNIQRSCVDVLVGTRTKIPYTDGGAQRFVLACNEACEAARERNFLAPGTWKGETVLNLENGDAMPAGYFVQAVPVAERPLTEKQLRICPPIYVCANLAGAIHTVTIRVDVQ